MIPAAALTRKVKIYGSKYQSRADSFDALMNKPAFFKTLFIFNDNERDHPTCRRGGGNATMRVYNRYNPDLEVPRSHGIPTGTSRGGYRNLSEGKSAIDDSFCELVELLNQGDYDGLMYSIHEDGQPHLGQSIFAVGEEVISYITLNLLRLGSELSYIKNGEIAGEGIAIDESFLSNLFPSSGK